MLRRLALLRPRVLHRARRYIKGKISKGEIERKQPKDSDYRTMDEDATTVRNNLSVIREYVPKGVAAKCCQKVRQ